MLEGTEVQKDEKTYGWGNSLVVKYWPTMHGKQKGLAKGD